MTRYIAARILAIIPVSLGISVIVFAMIHLVPGDAVIALTGPAQNPETIAQARKILGLDAPVHVQYLRWLARALRGDLGDSIYLRRPVLPELITRFRRSILLAVSSFVLAVPVGIWVGTVAALARGSILDRLTMMLSTAGISMPPFYLGMLLIVLFSVRLHWLPAGGMFNVTGNPTPGAIMTHLILPALTLAGVPLAVVARMVRTSMLEVLRKDYIRTARAKGLSSAVVIWRHAFKNALIPIIALLALQIGYLLSATALVEVVFSWPGLGSLIVQSILTRDLPVAQGAVLLIAVLYVLVNVAADLLQLALDPRIKYG